MDIKTAVIQIGNSDDKLSQRNWNKFIVEIDELMFWYKRHFCGFSTSDSAYQNAAWVIEVDKLDIDDLRTNLGDIGNKWGQDGIALTIGETEFV